jgi:hypothetical protein
MNEHKLVHKVSFDWPEKVARMCVVNIRLSFESVPAVGSKWFWVCWKSRECFERVANDISIDTKTLWKVGHDWSGFQGDWLILLFSRKDGQRCTRWEPRISGKVAQRFIDSNEWQNTSERNRRVFVSK